MPRVFWDARQLLDCYPLVGEFECTGITAEGARCRQTFIDRKSESDNILSTISSSNIVLQGLNNNMQAQLRHLAELTLCPRWHRDRQVNAVYLRWVRAIDGYIAEQRARIEMPREQIQRPLRVPQPAAAPVRVPEPAGDVRRIPVRFNINRSRPRNVRLHVPDLPDPF